MYIFPTVCSSHIDSQRLPIVINGQAHLYFIENTCFQLEQIKSQPIFITYYINDFHVLGCIKC